MSQVALLSRDGTHALCLDDGTSPLTPAEATEDLTKLFERNGQHRRRPCSRTRRPRRRRAASSRGFLADGPRTFMRDFPEQTFHVRQVTLEAPDAYRERHRRRPMAATVLYVARGRLMKRHAQPLPRVFSRGACGGQLADENGFDPRRFICSALNALCTISLLQLQVRGKALIESIRVSRPRLKAQLGASSRGGGFKLPTS